MQIQTNLCIYNDTQIVFYCIYLSHSENTYDTVGPKEAAAQSDHVAMETNPAYASVH